MGMRSGGASTGSERPSSRCRLCPPSSQRECGKGRGSSARTFRARHPVVLAPAHRARHAAPRLRPADIAKLPMQECEELRHLGRELAMASFEDNGHQLRVLGRGQALPFSVRAGHLGPLESADGTGGARSTPRQEGSETGGIQVFCAVNGAAASHFGERRSRPRPIVPAWHAPRAGALPQLAAPAEPVESTNDDTPSDGWPIPASVAWDFFLIFFLAGALRRAVPHS